jgi:hypothetical protein
MVIANPHKSALLLSPQPVDPLSVPLFMVEELSGNPEALCRLCEIALKKGKR